MVGSSEASDSIVRFVIAISISATLMFYSGNLVNLLTKAKLCNELNGKFLFPFGKTQAEQFKMSRRSTCRVLVESLILFSPFRVGEVPQALFLIYDI